MGAFGVIRPYGQGMSSHQHPQFSTLHSPPYLVQHKDSSLALGGDEEAQDCLAALGAVVQVDVANASWGHRAQSISGARGRQVPQEPLSQDASPGSR